MNTNLSIFNLNTVSNTDTDTKILNKCMRKAETTDQEITKWYRQLNFKISYLEPNMMRKYGPYGPEETWTKRQIRHFGRNKRLRKQK